jgi:dTMP kinase
MFITFEGPEGSGKTTQIPLLASTLEEQGVPVLCVREPGGTFIGEKIRDILHNPEHTSLEDRAEVLLYSASRAQIVSEVLRPALAAGKVILCDRFFDSTFAYQGYGRGFSLDDLRHITLFATGGLRPNLTFYIDIPPEEGLRRRKQDSDAEWNRLDALALEFHQRVYDGYQALIESEPERWFRVDGRQSVEQVQQVIRGLVMSRLPVNRSG